MWVPSRIQGGLTVAKRLLPIPLLLILAVALLISACSSGTTTSTSPTTAPPVSTTATVGPTSTTGAPPSGSTAVPGGTLVLAGTPLPKNIGYQPTMGQTDKSHIFETIAETLMTVNTKGELLPKLATSVETDPVAKTITWHLREGVTFHDGTPFNAAAVAWNFQQLKDAGVLQYGDSVSAFTVVDDKTVRFDLTSFGYQYVQAFASKIYILSPTAIEKNGKDWAISNVSATGPFMLDKFDPASVVTVVKNPKYWQAGKPYLDGIEERFNLDSAVLSAAIQSNEIQLVTSGDTVLLKDLAAKGFNSVQSNPNKTVEFLAPSSSDPSSPLSNSLVRQACEYAIDFGAVAKGLFQGTQEAMTQMSYPGAVGYEPARNRNYDVAKAQQLLEQAGFPGGKGISISIYGTTSAPSVARRTAIAGYLQAVGITVKIESMPFPTYATMQAEGWKNGFMDCLENNGEIWGSAYLAWLGPLPTANPIPSLGRSTKYDELAKQVLTAPDAATTNGIVSQLIQQNYDDAMVMPAWMQSNIWIASTKVHTEEAASAERNFDWASVWMEK
jgi:peptide/nickel transport system substrate-binding protein